MLHCLWNNWNSIFMNHSQFMCLNLSDIGIPEFSIYFPTTQSPAGCLLGVWLTEMEYTSIKNAASPKLADEHTHCCIALPSPKLFFDNLFFFNLMFKATQLQMLHCSWYLKTVWNINLFDCFRRGNDGWEKGARKLKWFLKYKCLGKLLS